MATDILGRELHDGDICVGKGTGQCYGMRVGVWSGKSIAFEGGYKRSMSDVFLVVNPTEKELAIKDDIENSLAEIAKKREEKKSIKTIPLSKLEVGGIYKGIDGYSYVYLGKRKVAFIDYYNNLNPDIQIGYCFVHIWEENEDEDIKNHISEIGYHGSHNIRVLKGNRKLSELIRKINLEFPIINEIQSSNTYRHYHYKLLIE